MGIDNGVARIFVWGGGTRPMSPGTFDVISRSRPDSVGGGVLAEIVRGLLEPTRFRGG